MELKTFSDKELLEEVFNFRKECLIDDIYNGERILETTLLLGVEVSVVLTYKRENAMPNVVYGSLHDLKPTGDGKFDVGVPLTDWHPRYGDR